MSGTRVRWVVVGGAALVILLVIFFAALLRIAGWWKIYEKAGEAGWKALIPIYYVIVPLRIVGRPWWWVLLLFVPVVNIVVMIIADNDLSNAFRKSVGFTVGLFLLHPIFVLILRFGDLRYVGPTTAAGKRSGPAAAPARRVLSPTSPASPDGFAG